MQRALLQYRKKENYDIVHKALELAGRKDLIGFGANCMIKPTKEEAIKNSKNKLNSNGNNNKSKPFNQYNQLNNKFNKNLKGKSKKK